MQTELTPAEIIARGQAIYERQLAEKGEAAKRGEFIMFDLNSGDYEIGGANEQFDLSRRLRARHPKGDLLFYSYRSESYLVIGRNVVIVGRVNARQQSLIQITVRGPQGQEQTLEARIDSGFNGGLTLPLEVVTALGLSTDRTDFVVLANGEQIRLTTYEATLILDGSEQTVPVFATGEYPLLGMLPLQGYRVCIDMIDGGVVTLILLSQLPPAA